MDIIYRW